VVWASEPAVAGALVVAPVVEAAEAVPATAVLFAERSLS